MKRKATKTYVDLNFKKLLKKEAAEEDTTVVELTSRIEGFNIRPKKGKR